MKRYLIFQGDVYYPSGGWNDFFGESDTLPEALEIVAANKSSSLWWWHIVDTETKTIVKEEDGYTVSFPPKA